MMIYLYIFSSMFFCGLFVFLSKRKHLLLMLLSLEYIVLILYFLLFMYLSLYNYDFFFSMIFLTMSVCEGVLGLSILIFMIRSNGNDYMKSFSFLW
nr:NADH dehydrogenase subunit 4L [Ulochaetes vacca]